MDSLTANERVDALLSLKKVAASVPDCKLTKEIIQLCEREAELLMRGINPSLLNGLRARILQLYYQFCREPKFNPEAARHLKGRVRQFQLLILVLVDFLAGETDPKR